MKVTTADGVVFEGATAADVLEAMRRDQWGKPPQTMEYVRGVQERVREMVGVEVRIDTADHLLDDMVSAGILSYGTTDGVIAGDFGDEKP